MGRTNPTYRDRLGALESEWGAFRRALRHHEQPHFDHLFEQARAYAHAAGYLNQPTPEIPLLVSVLLAHERRLAALEAQLSEREHGRPRRYTALPIRTSGRPRGKTSNTSS